MTQVKFRNGSVVSNTYIDESSESDISEVYTWIRVLKNQQANFRYALREERRDSDDYADNYELPEDSDVVKYHEYLRDVTINGVAVGEIQREVTKFTGNDYFSNHNLGDAIATGTPNETEQKIEGKVGSELSNRDKRVLKHFEGATVPLTPDKEEMPLFVASNDMNEGLHTFEEAVEMWDQFLSHIDVDISDSVSDESDDDESDEQETSDSSDQPSVNDPTTIEGVGPATVDKIESNGFEIVPTLDRSEHVDAEPFGFESDQPEESQTGMPPAEDVIELQENGWTKDEIKDFYGE
jgi:hypothetical protein